MIKFKSVLKSCIDAPVIVVAKLFGWTRWFKGIRNHIYSKYISQVYGLPNVEFAPKIGAIIHPEYMTIGPKTGFGFRAIVTTWPNYKGYKYSPSLRIGRECAFGDYVHITAVNSITIGDNVLTGRWVTITDNGHGTTDFESLNIPPIERPLYSKGSVVIGDNVWIGDKVTILPGVTIGESAVIAANSVVTHDIPSFSVAAGNPAKIIKRNLY